MLASGAQVKAARAMLGWSQKDLAEAAGLHPNAIRYYEATHAQPFDHRKATSWGAERITEAFRKAGLMLQYDPPGVVINPDVFKPRKPPMAKRWERYWRPDSKPGRLRAYQIRTARMIRGWPQMPEDAALEFYAELHR